MAFKTKAVARSEGANKEIDFEALNAYIVETCALQTRETLAGYVSAIVDLGVQSQDDAEVVFTGSAQDEEEAIKKNPGTYFKNGIDPVSKKRVRFKCWKQRDIQSVAVAVDFPEIMLDKGQFFGNSEELPLRMWLGGNFYTKESGQIIGRPTPLKITKNTEGKWSFAANHLFYKMAVASKLIQPGEVFLPEDIDQLLGKAFQFEVQVYMKENKGKEYLTEYVKYIGALSRSQKSPEKVTEPFVIQFDEENDEEAIKELRQHVVNTMKRSPDYAESAVRKQIEKIRGVSAPKAQDTDEDASEDSGEDADEDQVQEVKETQKPVVASVKVPRKVKDAPKKEELKSTGNAVADIPDDDLGEDTECPF